MSVIFVGGVNRSGSTLLQSILCSDPATNPLVQEASYLRFIVHAWAFGREQFDFHTQYYFDSTDELKQFTADWLKAFLDKFRGRYPDAQHLVLRHLPLTARFPELQELTQAAAEDIRLVIVVRDPRDVVASMVRVGEKAREQGRSEEGQAMQRDVVRLSSVYLQTYGPALSCRRPDYRNCMTVVRYEDLVTGPAETLDVLRRATGLELAGFKPDEAWSRNDMDMEELNKVAAPWVSDLWGKGVSRARIGTYLKILTPEEIGRIEQVCAEPLKSFGYT